MNKIDGMNYKYAFVRSMTLLYVGFTMLVFALFRFKFDAFFLISTGFFTFNAMVAHVLYKEISLSPKLASQLMKIYSIDFFIVLIGCFLFFPVLFFKLATFFWLVSLTLGYEPKGTFDKL